MITAAYSRAECFSRSKKRFLVAFISSDISHIPKDIQHFLSVLLFVFGSLLQNNNPIIMLIHPLIVIGKFLSNPHGGNANPAYDKKADDGQENSYNTFCAHDFRSFGKNRLGGVFHIVLNREHNYLQDCRSDEQWNSNLGIRLDKVRDDGHYRSSGLPHADLPSRSVIGLRYQFFAHTKLPP
jgi:hypothetical protein